MGKVIEWIKNDKLKAGTIGVSLLVFIVGIVVTAVNSGDTYASDLSDYTCSTSGYSPVLGSDNNYYFSHRKFNI